LLYDIVTLSLQLFSKMLHLSGGSVIPVAAGAAGAPERRAAAVPGEDCYFVT
jgi:hypothetical protein